MSELTNEQHLQIAKNLASERSRLEGWSGMAVWAMFKIWYLRHHDIREHVAIDIGDTTIDFNSMDSVINYINGFN